MKVLVVRVGAMGDVVHALHAVAALRRARPEVVVDWVVDPRWAALVVGAGGGEDAGYSTSLCGGSEGRVALIRRVHLADTKLWKAGPLRWRTLRSIALLRRTLRAERYDLVVDLQGTLRSALIGKFAHAQDFYGWAKPRERVAARFYRATVARRGVHVVEQMVALLGAACGVELEDRLRRGLALPDGRIPAEEISGFGASTRPESQGARPLAVLSAGGGWGAKLWPEANFGALAAKLAQMGFDVVVNAARDDDAAAAAVVAASGGAARMVVSDVAGLVAMLRRAQLCVGGDTGPVHVAAALGVPVVALFGPTDPARNGPRGEGPMRVLRHGDSGTSYRHVAEIDHGLARIGVEEVVAAVRQIAGLRE